jgi:hypothetical protein
MNTFVLVVHNEEEDSCEMLGLFASTDEALDAVRTIEEGRDMHDVEEGATFVLDDPTSPDIGVMPAGRDPTREFRVLVKGDADEAEDDDGTDDTDYYVLEF